MKASSIKNQTDLKLMCAPTLLKALSYRFIGNFSITLQYLQLISLLLDLSRKFRRVIFQQRPLKNWVTPVYSILPDTKRKINSKTSETEATRELRRWIYWLPVAWLNRSHYEHAGSPKVSWRSSMSRSKSARPPAIFANMKFLPGS